MKRLTLEQIVRRLRHYRPTSAADLLITCKLPLEFVGDGQYRFVFRISGTPYVIKVPRLDGISHAQQEIKASKLLRKDRYYAIYPYLPTFHFTNRNTGIILTDLCTWASFAKNFDTIKYIHEWSKDQGFPDADVGTDKSDNYGMLGKQLKILDLGCFTAGGEC